jgi:hypothetical protein
MADIKEKVQALIDKYDSELSSKGIKILLSKRYFENAVEQRSGGHGIGGLLNSIERARDLKKEKELYKFQRNKYNCLVLTICPTEKGALRKDDYREYAFLLKKIERAHVGLEPRKIVYHEEKLLFKIEKQIIKILEKAEEGSARKVCQNNIIDALRYSTHTAYGYKDKFLGKDRLYWDTLLSSIVVCITILIILTCWILFN